jgi:toxin ParE1/3/4
VTRRYAVILTQDAAEDLDDISEYIAVHDSSAKADHVVDSIAQVIDSLGTLPERGPYTKELLSLGVREFRETYFKPYRVIYGVKQRQVTIYVIADGRRDMQTLLQKRLLRP